MHDRRHQGQEPTVVVDDPTDPNPPSETFDRHDASAGDPSGELGGVGTALVEEPESLFARRAKLIALLLAATAVVVSVVVAAVLANDAEPPGKGQTTEPSGITGAAALDEFPLPGTFRSPEPTERPPAASTP